MRIGFFTDHAYPGGYGVEFATEAFKNGLERLGHEVFIYAPYDKEVKDANQNIFRFKAVRIQKNPKMFFNFPFLPVKKSWKEVINFKLDIVHAQSPFNLGLLAKHIARKQKVPFVYTYHTDLQSWVKANMWEKFITPRLALWWVGHYSNQADAVIAISSKIKAALQKMKVKKPIYVLPNCIDLKLFYKDRSKALDFRKKYDISLEAKVLIFVGRLSKEKNLIFLLQTLAEILKKKKDVFLLLVGSGYQMDALKKVAEDLGVAENVRFTGFIPHDEVASYYNMADIFVMSSLSEIMPLVVLEAMACGLPIVVLDDPIFHDIVFEGQNGFRVKEQKPEVFAEKVQHLLDDRELYSRFSQTSLEVATRFSNTELTRKLIEIYQFLRNTKIPTKLRNIYENYEIEMKS
jgi:glycosyltransferase involved in cell wall biosynthesis